MDCARAVAIRIPEYPGHRDQGKTDQAGAGFSIWEKVSKILMENECEPPAPRVIDLVAHHGITAYDGQFIVFALEMGIPCVTEVRELQGKFPDIAISMDEFLRPESTFVVREPKSRYHKRKV